MWGFVDDDIYVTRCIRVEGYKMMNARGKGFLVLRFGFLVVNFEDVELIGLVELPPEFVIVPLN